MESAQLRKENDTSGPQDELEYWKRRAAQFSQLLAHLEVYWTTFDRCRFSHHNICRIKKFSTRSVACRCRGRS